MTWNNPLNWVAGMLKTKDMTKQLEENITHLYERNRVVKTNRNVGDTNQTFPFATQTITTKGGDLLVSVSANCYTTVVEIMSFDIEVMLDGGGSVWASTGTSTPSTYGVYQAFFAANSLIPVTFKVLIPNIPAGTHTIRLRKSPFTVTAYVARTDRVAQIAIEEYGIAGTDKVSYDNSFDWTGGSIVTTERLNKQIRDNMNYLFERNYVYKNSSTLYQTTSVSFIPVGIEKIALKTQGRDIQVSLLAPLVTVNENARDVFVDVLVDDSFYISSLTDTPLSDGWLKLRSIAGRVNSFYLEHIITDMDEGWHTFELYYKSSHVTSNARFDGDSLTQIMAEEIGIRS